MVMPFYCCVFWGGEAVGSNGGEEKRRGQAPALQLESRFTRVSDDRMMRKFAVTVRVCAGQSMFKLDSGKGHHAGMVMPFYCCFWWGKRLVRTAGKKNGGGKPPPYN